jgi:hypothetical protein
MIEEKTTLYLSKVESYNAKAEQYKKRSFRLSLMRVVVLIATIGALFYLSGYPIWVYIGVIMTGVIFFGYLVLSQHRSDQSREKAHGLTLINQNEINCLSSFDNHYDAGERFEDGKHFYSGDLDLFGSPSLFGIINRAKTYYGQYYLSQWLTKLDSISVIESRQAAVIELESEVAWRQSFANDFLSLEGEKTSNTSESIDRLLDRDLNWSTGLSLTVYRRIVPMLWLLLAGSYWFFPSVVYSLASLLTLVNLAISFYHGKKVTEVQMSLTAAFDKLGAYADALSKIIKKPFLSPYIADDMAEIHSDEIDKDQAVDQLISLKKIMDYLDYRLFMIVGALLNIFFLWDIRCIYLLAHWQKNNEHMAHKIFQLIGKVEAVCSLATWSFNHDFMAYAKFSPDQFTIEAENLGHPLLSIKNVLNDFKSGPSDHITIITGSNMAGKSTFLRTVGINLILAYAGTRVYASQMTCSLAHIISYMRIKDALEESVSTFKAELNRIQLILDELDSGKPCFILIDEMLRGTNSLDKLKGSIGITKKLLSTNAYAMIATHDIKLAEMGREFPQSIKNYFFDIDFKDGDLQFDYKLKPGICENFNASYLISQLGIQMDA